MGVDIHLLSRNVGTRVKIIEKHYSAIIAPMAAAQLNLPRVNTKFLTEIFKYLYPEMSTSRCTQYVIGLGKLKEVLVRS